LLSFPGIPPADNRDHIQTTATIVDARPDMPTLSTASKTILEALYPEKSSPLIIEYIIRKFLIPCHSPLLDLTVDSVLPRITHFHNKLKFSPAVLHHHQLSMTLKNDADMFLAEAYALFISGFEQKVNEES
jgi:hypothetical protein